MEMHAAPTTPVGGAPEDDISSQLSQLGSKISTEVGGSAKPPSASKWPP